MNTAQINAMIRHWDNVNMELLIKVLTIKGK